MPRELRAFLRQQAEAFLASHRITEPLEWEPPVEWAGAIVSWPGRGPELIDHQAFYETAKRALDITRMIPEVGMHPHRHRPRTRHRTTRIVKYAKQWGIPIRAKGRTPDPLIQAGLRGTLSPELEAAFTGLHAVQRVRRVVKLPGHRSIRAAAHAQGVGNNIINKQLKAMEQAVGFQIINRTIPLTVTPRGQAFIHNAEQVLQQLDVRITMPDLRDR
jgi:hypothetical protein